MSTSSKDDDLSGEPATESKVPTERPFPSSLCHRCAAHRYIQSGRGSVFILCSRLSQKYPRQPVSFCSVFEPISDESGSKNEK